MGLDYIHPAQIPDGRIHVRIWKWCCEQVPVNIPRPYKIGHFRMPCRNRGSIIIIGKVDFVKELPCKYVRGISPPCNYVAQAVLKGFFCGRTGKKVLGFVKNSVVFYIIRIFVPFGICFCRKFPVRNKREQYVYSVFPAKFQGFIEHESLFLPVSIIAGLAVPFNAERPRRHP